MPPFREIDKIRFMRELEASNGRLLLATIKKTFLGTDADALIKALQDEGRIIITKFNDSKYIEKL